MAFRRDEGIGKWSKSKRGKRIRRSLWGNGYTDKAVNRRELVTARKRRKRIRRLLEDFLILAAFLGTLLYIAQCTSNEQ